LENTGLGPDLNIWRCGIAVKSLYLLIETALLEWDWGCDGSDHVVCCQPGGVCICVVARVHFQLGRSAWWKQQLCSNIVMNITFITKLCKAMHNIITHWFAKFC